jgi:hypothetical protein
MGLDMYLRGRKSKYHSSYNMKGEKQERPKEDGFEVCYTHKDLELGYWRKHPNLHGYIVQEFADGVDECQEIELEAKDIEKIMLAVKEDRLPHTTGFFFGSSDGAEKKVDLEVFGRAREWLTASDADCERTVFYRASW